MQEQPIDYFKSLRSASVPQEDARYVLPNATATEIAVTMTFEHWRHFLDLRCDPHAQWEIRRCSEQIRELLTRHVPQIF